MSPKHFSIMHFIILSISCAFVVTGCTSQTQEDTQELFGYSIISPPDSVLLALYDGSEIRTAKNNEIEHFLRPSLEHLGFETKYHDIDKGLPSERTTRNIRGIITWFTDSQIKDADSYCQWLAGQVREGKKVFILDNFGAYQDAASKKWTEVAVVNSVLKQLGVVYKANCKSNPGLLEIVYADKDVLETVAAIDASLASQYYPFEKTDQRIIPFLTLRRKDSASSESRIVFSHPNGGMASSRYIAAHDKDTGLEVPNVDLLGLVENSFFPDGIRTQRVLIVWEDLPFMKKYIKNIIKTLEYAKVEFDLVRLTSFRNLLLPDLKQYSTIVLYSDNLRRIARDKEIKNIREYLRGGGGLLVANMATHESLLDVFGIKTVRGFHPELVRGLKITSFFFPGAEQLHYDTFKYRSFKVDLRDDVQVLARAFDKTSRHPEGIPIAWLNRYGKGRVVFWNCDCMHEMRLRGLLLQSLLLTPPVSISSLANIEIIHVDDAPQPMYNIYSAPLQTACNMTDTEFYLNVWWPDILDLSKRFDIKYTFYMIFNYDGKTRPPFDGRQFDLGKGNAFRKWKDRIIDNDFELGLHGYNHQSLTLKSVDYDDDWGEATHMLEATKQAARLWKEVLHETETPFSYVAPMNVIDADGKAALHKAFPTIRVISKLYSDTEEMRYQEFGQDTDYPYFFAIPRVTAGYFFNQTVKTGLINSINTFGIWTHFIHPNDVFGVYAPDSEETSGGEKENAVKGWESMFQSTNHLFSFVRDTFPWLRNMATKDAYYELVKYFNYRARVEIDDNVAKLFFTNGTDENKFFAIRINNGRTIVKTKDCKLIHSYATLNLHIFETESTGSQIELTNE